MLRDRIVCDINDDSIQRRLLSEAVLTLKEALKLALSFESATRNARELHHLHQLQHDDPLERMLAKHQLVYQEGLVNLGF